MKILHIARQYAPSIGGIQSAVSGLAGQQVARGDIVEVATLARSQVTGRLLGPSNEVIAGVTVHRLKHFGPRQYSVALGVARLLRGYDVIHVHSFDFFCDFVAWLEPWHRTPLIINTHGLFFHTGNASGLKELYLRTMTRVSLGAYRVVVADSEGDRQRLGPIRRDICVIPNGIDHSRFASIKRAPEPATLLGMSSGPHKRADLLQATFSELSKDIPAARLLLTASAAVARANGAESLGRLTAEEFATALSKATIWCNASDYEGFGIAVLEAMAAGVPAAVRPDNPLASLQSTGGLFIVDFRQPRLAATQLAALLKDPNTLRSASISARLAAREFGWQHIEPRYRAVYEEALTPR